MSVDLSELTDTPEQTHLLEQYQEQISDYKRELAGVRQHILTTCTADEATALKTATNDADKILFDLGLSIQKKLCKPTSTPTTSSSSESKAIKLPKPHLMVTFCTGKRFGNSSQWPYTTVWISQRPRSWSIRGKH